MALTNSNDLFDRIADWLNRSDLSSQIPSFVDLAVNEMQRKLTGKIQDTVLQYIVSDSDAIAKSIKSPLRAYSIVSITDSNGRALSPVSYSEYKNISSTSGASTVYAVSGGDIYIGPNPSSGDSFSIQYDDGANDRIRTTFSVYEDQSALESPQTNILQMYSKNNLQINNTVTPVIFLNVQNLPSDTITTVGDRIQIKGITNYSEVNPNGVWDIVVISRFESNTHYYLSFPEAINTSGILEYFVGFSAPAAPSDTVLNASIRVDKETLTYPEAILMGSLMFAYIYLKDDARVTFFQQKFLDAIQDINRKDSGNLGLGRIKDESIAANGGPLV
jgi:hypothetical protein